MKTETIFKGSILFWTFSFCGFVELRRKVKPNPTVGRGEVGTTSFSSSSTFSFTIFAAFWARGVMAAVSLAVAEAFTADNFGAVAIWNIESSGASLMRDEWSLMDNNDSFKTLLTTSSTKVFLWSTSQVFESSIALCSTVLMTRSSGL